MRIEDEQNIEWAIIKLYEDDKGLLDLEVLDALDALVRRYTLEERGDGTRNARLSDRPHRVFEATLRICEWRLGRGPVVRSGCEPEQPKLTPLTVSQLLLCLKRLRKSVRLWNDQGGRQGYLNYAQSFVGEGGSALGG